MKTVGRSDWYIGHTVKNLTMLRYVNRFGSERIKGLINIEGNLTKEDCMFSEVVTRYDRIEFKNEVYDQVVNRMKNSNDTGYKIIANNLELNTNVTAYYYYSFQTVDYSAAGFLLDQFTSLNIPKLFIYGDRNRKLSYLQLLKDEDIRIAEIPQVVILCFMRIQKP